MQQIYLQTLRRNSLKFIYFEILSFLWLLLQRVDLLQFSIFLLIFSEKKIKHFILWDQLKALIFREESSQQASFFHHKKMKLQDTGTIPSEC